MKIKWIINAVLIAAALLSVGIFVSYQIRHPELTRMQCFFDCWVECLIACICVVASKFLTDSIRSKK